jgi:small-conductance mechanosensitive channel
MPALDPAIAGFIDDNRDTLTAAATLVLAVVFAQLVDRTIRRRGRTLSERMAGERLSPEAETRLRLLRRLTFAVIILLGIALALAQFPAVKRLATGVLASSAVLGLVIGFAARATLANAVAGVLLAITQPIRVGDLVTFQKETGIVEDVRLAYTTIRLDNGRRLVVPNERLVQSSVENHTVVDPRVQVEASVWIPPGADADRAIELIADPEHEVEAAVAEVDRFGIRLSAFAWCDDPQERGPLAARLRAEWLRALRAEGLSSAVALPFDPDPAPAHEDDPVSEGDRT